MKITLKSINKLFDSMKQCGIKEIFLSRTKQTDVYNEIDKWFYGRNKNVSDQKYVHMEVGDTHWAFVRQPQGVAYEDRLRIVFVKYDIA